jgi:hypothetical protein
MIKDSDQDAPKTGSGSPTPEKMAHLLVEVMCEKSLAVRNRRLKARSETDSRKKRAMKRTKRFIAEKRVVFVNVQSDKIKLRIRIYIGSGIKGGQVNEDLGDPNPYQTLLSS